MTTDFLKETNQDYQEFMEATPVAPPPAAKNRIFSFIHKDLNPNPWLIFSKMALIHFSVGTITLSLCPQFGFRFFGEGLGLMKVFLAFGAYGCMALCGGFFIGSSLFATGILLRREEFKVLRRERWLQISALTFLSLGALLMTDAEIVFSFAAAWAVGSILGGVVMLELGQSLKLRTS